MSNGHRRGQRQAKAWDNIPGAQIVMAADGTFSTASLLFGEPFTVLRMIGEYQIRSTGNVTALETAVVTVAIGVVSTDAVTAAALPDPGEEPEFPWLFWRAHTLYFGGSQSPGDAKSGAGHVRASFDIRSMRKVKPRESLVWVAQYADIVGAPALTIDQGQVRVLLGIH